MAGSVSSSLWSNIYYLYMAIALIVGGLVIAWCLYSMVKYRQRPGQKRPADAPRAGFITRERGHVLGAYVMAGGIAAIMFGLAFSTIDAVNALEIPPEDEPAVHYEVVGFQFGWQFRYFGEYLNETTGEMTPFNFTEVNNLRVPVDTVITADVTSRDVQHVFGIPDYRIQIYAIPGQVLPIWFQATDTGEVPIRCLRNCGVGHNDMIKAGTLHVLSAEEYQAFIQSKAPKQQAPATGAGNDTTQARSLLLEDGQLVVDTPTLVAGRPAEVTVMNRADEARVFTAGPSDAPLATLTVPAGETATFNFHVPADAQTLTISARPEDATQPDVTQTFEVMRE